MKGLLLAAALAAIAPSLSAAAPPAEVVVNAERRLDHISVVKIGRGSPLVLIPGLSSPRAVWSEFAPTLAERHTVYLVQVNGFGGDDPGRNVGRAVIDGIASDLSKYLKQEKAGPVRLVGHSLGGLIGLMFARVHPEQVERLMIVDALPYFPAIMAPGGEAPPATSVEPIARSMRDRVAARHGKAADSEALRAETAGLALKPESRAKIAQWAAAADPRVTAQLLYEDMITDLRPELPGIKAPVTLLYPWSAKAFGQDPTLKFYQRQYAGSTSIRFVGIAEAGHFVMLDQPDEFAAALREFAE